MFVEDVERELAVSCVLFDGPSLICPRPVFDLALNPDMKEMGLDWTGR